MKKKLLLFTSMILLYLGFGLFACKDSVEKARKEIVGQWNQIEPICFEASVSTCSVILFNNENSFILAGNNNSGAFEIIDEDSILFNNIKLGYQFSKNWSKLEIYDFGTKLIGSGTDIQDDYLYEKEN